MPDSSIIARIGGDASGLISALETGKAAASKFGDDFQRVIAKKLDFRDVLKGVFQGIGIASVGAIADKIVDPFREAAESAKSIADETERGANATELLIKLRQNDNEQLATMENAMRRIRAEAEAAVEPSKTFWGLISRGSAADILFGFSRREDAEIALNKQKLITAEAELAGEFYKKQTEVADKAYDQMVKNAGVATKYVRENYEMLLLEAKAYDGRLLPAERDRLQLLRLQVQQKIILSKLEDALAIPAEQRTEKERDNVRQLVKQNEIIDKQIAKLTEVKAGVAGVVVEQKKVTVEVKEQEKVLFRISGRGNKELSDRELERKVGSIKGALFQEQLREQATGSPSFGAQMQRFDLEKTLQELALRRNFRRDVATFGEDPAFRRSGFTESRAGEIRNDTSGQATLEKTLKAIEDLAKLFRDGQATVRSVNITT